MSQNFRLKFDKMRENNPTLSEGETVSNTEQADEFYTVASQVRNLCLAWPDGKRMFLNYTYLVSGEYSPLDNKIDLLFTTHAISLKGYHLGELFDELIGHLPKQITCIDARYNTVTELGKAAINEIIVTPLNA